VGYARLFQPSVATQFIGLAYNGNKDVDGLAGDIDGPEENPQNEYISEGFELQHLGGKETRNGYVAAIEWRPVDNFTLSADAFLSRFDSESFARGFRVKLGGPSAAYANPILDGNAVIGGAVNRTTNSFMRVETVNDDNQDSDEVDSFGVNANWEVTDKLTVSADVSLSSAKSDFRNGLLWALVAEDANAENPVLDTNVSLNYQLNGLNLPDIGFNQAEYFTDIDKMMVSKYGIYPFQNEDELTAFRLDFDYELDSDWFSSIEFGVRYSDREYSNDRSVFEYGNDGAFSSLESPLRLTDDMVNVVDWQGDFSYFPSYLAIDLQKALAAWFPNGAPQPVQTWGNADGVVDLDGDGTPDSQGYTTNYSWSVLQSGSVYEKVLSAYVMVNINGELGDLPVTGNIGIRRVDTDQSATILENVNGNPSFGAQNIVDEIGIVNNFYSPNVLGEKYTDYLPSLNLNFALTDNQQLRFAAAKVMSRAPINRLAGDASASVNNDGEINGSSTNNPFLRPFYANQFDLSYEYYFEETDGAFVVAGFYKNIDSFIDTIAIEGFDFAAAGFNVPETIEDPVSGELIETTNGVYTTAVNNANGGYIRGLELAYTQVFSFLPEPFDGLGLNASYSFTQSEVESITSLGGETITQALPGLSENVLNTTLFYNYQDFETRVNMRYRDEFVSEQVAINEQVVNFDGETVFDFQAQYDFNEHFGVLFQVNNLTDEPTLSYFGNESRTGTMQYFGRQFYLGFTLAN
jgi:TonB-dependent receptor